MSERESMQNNDDDKIIKDEQARKDIEILSERLYDIKERFMKVIQKINNDAIGFVEQTSEEGNTTNDESNSDISFNEDNNDVTKTSSNDENSTEKSKIFIRTKNLIIQSIIKHEANHNEYFKNITQYPKIMKYLIDDNPNHINISLRHLEPFIKQHVNQNPNRKIYDKVRLQIQDIRRSYLENYQ